MGREWTVVISNGKVTIHAHPLGEHQHPEGQVYDDRTHLGRGGGSSRQQTKMVSECSPMRSQWTRLESKFKVKVKVTVLCGKNTDRNDVDQQVCACDAQH